MALTRKMLKAMGIEEDKIEMIISEHADSIDALKEERDTYKAEAEKIPEIQKQLDAANEAAKNSDSEKLQIKYDALKEEFETYKTNVTNKESRAAKETAYKALLKDAGINEKRIDAVMRVSKIDDIELDENGAIKGAEELTTGIKSEWADFIVTENTHGADTATPPETGEEKDLGELSMKEYIAARTKK